MQTLFLAQYYFLLAQLHSLTLGASHYNHSISAAVKDTLFKSSLKSFSLFFFVTKKGHDLILICIIITIICH